ncbi:MAG: hypothetical protein JSV91_09150 [Phycisphaerales bacterium]|nr:MAG: hypothetical protein JSV91_09150 [Phycisphaerales bacterium]
MRRFILAILLLIVIIAGVLFVALRGRLGITAFVGEGTTELEQWCGRQLLKLADSYLRPDFSYESLDYEYPATVTLQDAALTDEGTAFITASSMRITFTETPRVGQPVVIERVEVTDPVVRLVRKENGDLVGFSDFIEPTRAPAGENGESSRLSDAFAIRNIRIVNGTFEYDTPDDPPMVLDQITFDLTGNPEAEPGWYAAEVRLAREPVLSLDLSARLNLDGAHLSLERSELSLSLEEDGIRTLPPSVQEFAYDHELTGKLRLMTAGELPLAGPAAADLALDANLTDAMGVFGKFRLPIEKLDLRSNLANRRWTIDTLVVLGLGGRLGAEAFVDLTDDYPAEATIDIRDALLEEVIRQAGAEGPPKYSGRVGLTGTAVGRLADFPGSLDGEGKVTVEEGRLINDPIIGGLARWLELSAGSEAGSDRGSADLTLMGDQLQLRDIDVVSASMAARGEGEIFFDSRIDFRLNAGPLEKLQSALGVVGDALGMITDPLLKYHVTGTLSKPEFAVKPLGLGTGNADSVDSVTLARFP